MTFYQISAVFDTQLQLHYISLVSMLILLKYSIRKGYLINYKYHRPTEIDLN